MNSSAIAISNLSKHYASGKVALDNVSLEIERGSFFGLLGPNGAGKSTLINILATLVKKTNGKVMICGHDIDRNDRQAKYKIGIVPQELVLDPFFTVREALEFHSGYYGVPKKKRRVNEIIEALGLTEKSDSKPRSLSGGMKRRLLIAKALVHSPEVLVLDEPTAGVDIDLRQQLWNYVRQLNKNGTTIILTTHYLEEAEQLCDSLAIINHGRLIKHDSKKNLMHLLDNKKIEITFDRPLDFIPSSLEKFGTVFVKNNVVVIEYKNSDMSINNIISNLSAEFLSTGLNIVDIKTLQPNLEDVFRYLLIPEKK